jgi:hypothetical protein
MKEILICHVPADDNVAVLMTKVLPSGERRDKLVEREISIQYNKWCGGRTYA